MIQHVRQYTSWGIPVFPVHWPQEGGARCSCKLAEQCENIGKHPMTKNGVDDATTDFAQLEPIWERYPDANIGLATGVVMDVLDLDNDDQAIKVLQDEIGLFCDDDPPIVQTGRGHHVWYRPIGSGNRAHMLPGVDWRGKGGYVLAPPSLHASGRRYELHGGPFETMPMPPQGLCDLVLRQGRYAPKRVKSEKAPLLDRLDEPAMGWSAHGLVRDMAAAVEGNRNSFLYWAACVIRDDLAAGRCDAKAANGAYIELRDAALDAGLGEHEARQTINSALKGEPCPTKV